MVSKLYFFASFRILFPSDDKIFLSTILRLSINSDVCPIRLILLIFFKFLFLIPLLPLLAGTNASIFFF